MENAENVEKAEEDDKFDEVSKDHKMEKKSLHSNGTAVSKNFRIF